MPSAAPPPPAPEGSAFLFFPDNVHPCGPRGQAVPGPQNHRAAGERHPVGPSGRFSFWWVFSSVHTVICVPPGTRAASEHTGTGDNSTYCSEK